MNNVVNSSPKTRTDAFFSIGQQDHPVCQDYALAGADRVMLSDGCSGSPHTDVGARILCQLAGIGPWGPRAGHHLFDVMGGLWTPGAAGLLSRAWSTTDLLGLPLTALDATLLVAALVEEKDAGPAVRVAIYGDGCVVARRRGTQDEYEGVLVEYESGAPYYPVYQLSRRGVVNYPLEYAKPCYRRFFGSGSYEPSFQTVDIDAPDAFSCYRRDFPTADYDLVLLLSDGVASFQQGRGGPPVPVGDVVKELLAVKSFNGVFMLRRARRFLQDCARRGWIHHDDFSVAAVYTEP